MDTSITTLVSDLMEVVKDRFSQTTSDEDLLSRVSVMGVNSPPASIILDGVCMDKEDGD